MTAPATGKAFAVLFRELTRWDLLSLSLARFARVNTLLRRVGDIFAVRKDVVSDNDLKSGSVRMLEKVSFDGEVFLGRESTRMTQFRSLPGDVLISKIRPRQGSTGLVEEDHGPVSVTVHYRVLIPDPSAIVPEYAWLAFRTQYVRNQFLASTGGAMKGEISEEALLDLKIPCPDIGLQQAIVGFWRAELKSFSLAQKALVAQVEALNSRLVSTYQKETSSDVIHSRFFALEFKDMLAWDTKSCRAAAFRRVCPSFHPMGDFIEDATELARPAAEPDKDWPVYGVNNREGVFLNSHQKGATFNAPYKRIRKDWFFHNPTRCNVGSLGIVPEVPEDAITSPEYQVWRLKTDIPEPMLPGYVACLIQTPFFLDLVQFNRVGAVKQRMYTENLMQVCVPYLPVTEQQHYADAREKALVELATAKSRLDAARQEVEAMILGTKKVTSSA
jgi:hypothetical protein